MDMRLIRRIETQRATTKIGRVVASTVLFSAITTFGLTFGIAMTEPALADTAYTEKESAKFVLSEETPISIGHGWTGIVADAKPVDMLSYGVHFHIPRNYIELVLQDKRDRTLDFRLVTLYPDMIGSTVTRGVGRLTEADKVWIEGSSPDLISIATVGGDIGKAKNGGYNAPVFTSEEQVPDQPWRYGLLRSTKSMAAISQDVYFQRPTASYPGFVVFCDRDGDMPMCRVRVRVSDDLLLQYEYHKELLPHWQTIAQKITNLIQSFIVKKEK
jgi:hypothetical protein